MGLFRAALLASVCLAAGAARVAAQDGKPVAKAATPPTAGSQENPLKVAVSEVIVPVTVTDDKGRFVTNLEQKDFKLYDENKEQTISYFNRERNNPVVAGFLVDLSNANRLRWKEFTEAIQELVVTVMPEPKKYSGYLIGYSTEAELMVNTTDDPEKILDRIRKIKPGGGAALYDAVYMACTSRTLVNGEPIEPRRVLIVVGDGHDNASKKSLEEVVEIAQRNLLTIYGVSTVSFGFNAEGEKNLTRLTEATGGRVVYPLQNVYSDVSGYLSTPSDEGNYALKVGTGGYASAIMKGIVNAVAATAGEIQTQYILRYTPSDTDVKREFRRIKVVVNLANVKVRAREGYFPFAP
jgi:Ca-activated chloride channel homolog